jgi:AraC-like DNA-binding protein
VGQFSKAPKRYLHLVFAEHGHTVAGWIRDRRLARCPAELLKPFFTVTEVAFRWGFNDAAQFSHAFRAQYGSSPRSFRQANTATGGKRRNCTD